MNNNKEGLFISFADEDRQDKLWEVIKANGSFSEALSVADWKPQNRALAIISLKKNEANYIGFVSRSLKSVVTFKDRYKFDNLISLEKILLTEIEILVQKKLLNYFIKSFSGVGKIVPPKTWTAVIDAILKLRPHLSHAIQLLYKLLDNTGNPVLLSNQEIVIQERDAFGTALNIFFRNPKLQKQIFGSWSTGEDSLNESKHKTNVSFLDKINPRFLSEESVIQFDLNNVPDYIRGNHVLNRSVFQNGNRRLDIIYANKNPLEHQLGVDLIYYNEYFESFILIQYKLMHKERESEFKYRPDTQVKKELDRMNKFLSTLKKEGIKETSHYRLNSDGFYFKLIPNKPLQIGGQDLLTAMYLTREYFELALSSSIHKGPNQGIVFTFQNCRYFSNSDFFSLYNKGWIGTNGITSHKLKEIVAYFLENGRSLMIAEESINYSQDDDY